MTNIWKSIALAAVVALGVSISAPAFAGPCFDQPNMARAVEDLKRARASLEAAEHNKGGWRDAAIRAADTAINEAKRGCEMANEHRR